MTGPATEQERLKSVASKIAREISAQMIDLAEDIAEDICAYRDAQLPKSDRTALRQGMAEMVYPAGLISLIISDIIDSPLEHIGSGPSIGDSTTFADACEILKKYVPEKKVPYAVKSLLKKGASLWMRLQKKNQVKWHLLWGWKLIK